ncbi:hypothetical protein [Hyphococcus sp.]|uniref:hypothetical protein n=1 Tax=Hyphococcus sp. TaxID=2038636 RepID=UPI00208B7351|nr:MAG: hypothetical protein DHS20C04_12420 [Marinicaulis sp.]
MNMFLRLLATAPRNMMLPIVAVMAGWYGGAKYGAPDYVMNTVEGMLAKGGAVVGSLLPGAEEKDAAPASGEEV